MWNSKKNEASSRKQSAEVFKNWDEYKWRPHASSLLWSVTKNMKLCEFNLTYSSCRIDQIIFSLIFLKSTSSTGRLSPCDLCCLFVLCIQTPQMSVFSLFPSAGLLPRNPAIGGRRRQPQLRFQPIARVSCQTCKRESLQVISAPSHSITFSAAPHIVGQRQVAPTLLCPNS